MNTPSTSQVRHWARERGVPVGDRGRLPADLVAQYLAAQHPPPSRRPAAAGPASPGVVIARTVNAKPRWDWQR